jgi:hypothetical protein
MADRFAVINGLYVAPNLMHHAVELLIKFTLLKGRARVAAQRCDGTTGTKVRILLNAL